MKNVKLVVSLGMYAQNNYSNNKNKRTLTETVDNLDKYLPKYFVLLYTPPRIGS